MESLWVERFATKYLYSHDSLLAQIKVTVDGGTNRWIEWLQKHSLADELEPPTYITGDLDSCRLESIEFFSKSTEVVKTLDQDHTDFTKCLKFLEKTKLDFFVSICESSGRFDHILANINTLFKNHQKSPELSRPVYILSSDSLTWLLPPGKSTIHIPENLRKYWCSLVPIGSRSTVTTTGLKWNLNNQVMEFGGIVSTSNRYDGKSDEVTIIGDTPLLWSMGISEEKD